MEHDDDRRITARLEGGPQMVCGESIVNSNLVIYGS